MRGLATRMELERCRQVRGSLSLISVSMAAKLIDFGQSFRCKAVSDARLGAEVAALKLMLGV